MSFEGLLDFDKDHSLEMSFDEFVSAWKWLELKKSPAALQKYAKFSAVSLTFLLFRVFDTIDRDGKGTISQEFIIGVMGHTGEDLTLSSQVDRRNITIQRTLKMRRRKSLAFVF